ncbi:MAG TPA: hypothetical protein VIH76_02850 [Candidatus Acidoferrales bacterium]
MIQRKLPVIFVARSAAALILAAVVPMLIASPSAAMSPAASASTDPGPKVTREIKGSLPTHDGQRLHLVTELGNVRVHTGSSGKVEYHITLGTDASDPDSQKLLKDFELAAHPTPDGVSLRGEISGNGCSGHLWVTFDVSVPDAYNIDVTSHGGNIETENVDGRALLTTSGGNISAGSVNGFAHFETGGGHITVKDVSGDFFASTGGGHITAGSISGNASLHTGGGHIRVVSIGGIAKLDTGEGGNISVEKSGGGLTADTRGGQIEVGEAGGQVHARTGGGGIRVVRSSGPTNLESVRGSIYLTQVNSAVRASTNAGGITAWLGPDGKLPAGCDLHSADGDIVVYIPKELQLTIDAAIQQGEDHRLVVDPAFPLKVSYDDVSNGSHIVRAAGTLNGGGEVLRLRTVAGNIRIVMSDANRQLQVYKLQMDQLQKRLVEIQKEFEKQTSNDDSNESN